MIEIRACAADFAQLVAAENAPKRGFGRLAAHFIRRNQIRGHDKNAPDPENSAIADEQADAAGINGPTRLVWITRCRFH